MRTEQVNIYLYSELSDEAKEKARDWYLDGEDFSWITEEARETLDKFCEIFPVEWERIDWECPAHSYWKIRIPEYAEELTGQRLATYIYNNYAQYIFKPKLYYKNKKERYSKIQVTDGCILTGVCYDMDILMPIYDFLNKPTNIDFRTLLNDCIYSLCHSVSSEIEYHKSEEGITDIMEANEYEFTFDGKRY